jgi:hypothetical protein
MTKRDYGQVTYEGKVYRLTQDAYIVDTETYHARAIGPDGEDVTVVWATTHEWDRGQKINGLETAIDALREEDPSEQDELPELEAELAELEALPHVVNIEDESLACDWKNPVKVF